MRVKLLDIGKCGYDCEQYGDTTVSLTAAGCLLAIAVPLALCAFAVALTWAAIKIVEVVCK